jgi:hypothetical protein
MIASLRSQEARKLWDWLIREGYFSPLNNIESFLFPAGSNCAAASMKWNQLKGSWNLALQALGWGRYWAEQRGQVSVLWQAARNNSFLENGYNLLVSPVVYLPMVAKAGPTPTLTPIPTNSPTPTSTPTNLFTPTPTPTDSPTSTPTSSFTPTPTPTNSPTPTSTPTSSFTPTSTPTPPTPIPWEKYERECENPGTSTVGQTIARSNASGAKVHGQFGTTDSAPWPAKSGYVTYRNINLPQLAQLYIQLTYSKSSPSSVPILIYLDNEPTPRATVDPINQGNWNQFTSTAPILLGSIENGIHSLKFYTDGQPYGVADLDKFILTR